MMTSRKIQSTRTPFYVFILWGDKFEERVTTIFATEFRQMGIGVKIVGLTGLHAIGINGLGLTADLTLGDALPLVDKAICIIAPCSAVRLNQSEDDPRLTQFMQQAHANHAHFIVSHLNVLKQTSLNTAVLSPVQFTIYTDSSDLIELAHTTALSLSSRIE